jgi:hypothetical protein
MKKYIYILAPFTALVLLCVLHACKKYNETPSKTVIISYPTVTLIGAADTTLSRGANWVDPGATWIDSTTGETGKITFAINTSTDSAYLLTYVATNKNGFISYNNPQNPTAVTRGVAVTNINNNADITGAYTCTGYLGPLAANVAKVSRGLFTVDNVDGFGDPSVIVIKSDSTVSIAPIYPSIVGPTSYFGTYVSSATIPETFTSTAIIYQPAFILTGSPPHITPQSPVMISFNATPLNGPKYPVTLNHN